MSRASNALTFDRLLEPVSRCFNQESARQLVGLRADSQAQARMAELASKANEGQLSAEERAEYERGLAVSNFIAILQAKARLFLARKQSS